jgi:hypothetical protein
VRGGRGLNRRLGVVEGLGFNLNRRGVQEDHARVHAVLVPVSLGGMTSGPQSSVTERERRGNGSGGGSCWAVGSFSGWTKMVPRGPFAFSYFSFSFLFCFPLNFGFKTFANL